MQHNILIGTPAYGARVTTAYLSSVLTMYGHFQGQVKFSLMTTDMPSIDLSRNLIATTFLNKKAFSHLLFIDADIAFKPSLIESMLAFDRPVCGGIYPLRDLSFERAWNVPSHGSAAERTSLSHAYLDPKFVVTDGDQLKVDQGFARVERLGAGVMLIRRDVIETLSVLPGMLSEYDGNLAKPQPMLMCFRPLQKPNGCPLGEDLSFCKRWIEECGGEIWANVNEPVTHVGEASYTGRYIDVMKHSFTLNS